MWAPFPSGCQRWTWPQLPGTICLSWCLQRTHAWSTPSSGPLELQCS